MEEQHRLTNFFSLPNPDDFRCIVMKYAIGHSVLHIQLEDQIHRGNILHSVFAPTVYFSGPIRWNGANFQVAPPDECLILLRRIEYLDNISDEKLLSDLYNYKLYTVETPRETIKIIAGMAKLHNEIWAL
jgi:hypothetical protein